MAGIRGNSNGVQIRCSLLLQSPPTHQRALGTGIHPLHTALPSGHATALRWDKFPSIGTRGGDQSQTQSLEAYGRSGQRDTQLPAATGVVRVGVQKTVLNGLRRLEKASGAGGHTPFQLLTGLVPP